MAELERSFYSRDQLLFSFLAGEIHLGLGNIADVCTKVIVPVRNVRCQMAERHLVSGGLVVVLLGRHFLKCCDGILFASSEHLAQSVRDGRLGLGGGSGYEDQDQNC